MPKMNKKKQLLSGYSELVEITLKTQPCFPILSNTLVIKASLFFEMVNSKLTPCVRSSTYFQVLRNKILNHPMVQQQLSHHSEAVTVITQCGAFGGFLSVFWILGYFGFSVLWVFIGKCVCD